MDTMARASSAESVERSPGAEHWPPRASFGGAGDDDMMVEDTRASLAAFDEEEWETLLRNAIPALPATPAGWECVEFKAPLYTAPEYSMYYRYELTWGVRTHHGHRGGASTHSDAARARAERGGGGEYHARDLVSCIEFEDPFLYVPDRSYFYRYELRQGLQRTWEM